MNGVPNNPVTCTKCGSDKGCPTRRICGPCRGSLLPTRRKYEFTPEMDEWLRRIYADHAGNRKEMKRALDLFAQRYKFPRHAPKYRAQRLGLTQDTRKPWSPEEIAVLRDLSGVKSAKEIGKRLKRGTTTVQAMMERLQLSYAVTEGYSREEVCMVLGCARKSVQRWIEQGKLKVDRASDRVVESSLRKFVRAHPDSYSLKRVDEMWFKSVIFPTFGLNHAAVPATAERML